MSTYYVATTGNDSTGDGSIGTPWRTIQKGCDNLSAGDTLYIRAGTYHEQVNMERSGTSGSRITIKAYTGETVVLDGQYTLPTGTYNAFFANNSDNTKIGPDTWRLDGDKGQINYEFAFRRLFTVNANYVTVEDIRIIRPRGHAIGSTIATTGNTVRNVQMWDCRHIAMYFYWGTTDLTVEDCDVRRAMNFAQFGRPGGKLNWGAAIQDSGNVNSTYTRCTVHDSWGEGIILGRSGCTLEDCIVSNTYSTAIYAEKANNCTVRRCMVYQTDDSLQLATGRGSAALAVSSEPWGTPNPGTSVSNARFENNIVVGYQTGIAWRTAGGDFDNCEFVNNTIVNSRNPINTPYYVTFGSTAGTLTACVMRNNLFYHNTAMASANAVAVNGSSRAGITFSNNLWQGITPVAWAQGTGDVSNGAGLSRPNSAIPHLPFAAETYRSGPTPSNYYIGDTESSAIDAGTATDAPTDDCAGNTRTGTTDIGAHEYGATSIPSGVTADFSGSTTSGTGSLTVQFFDASSGSPTSWAWEYREAASSTYTWFSGAQNPVRTFGIGTFAVRLTVSDTTTSDTKTRAAYITVVADTGDSGGTGTPGGTGGASISTSTADTTNTSTGEQSLVYGSELTPTAAVIVWAGAESNGTARDEAAIGVGVTDGTNDYAIGATAEHGAGTIQNNTITREAVIANVTPNALTSRSEAAHVDFSAGGETINWTKTYTTAFRLAGLGIVATNAAAGVCTPHATADSSINITPGFTPDALIFIHTGTNAPALGNDYRSALGFAVNGGDQIAVSWRYDDDTASQLTAGQIASTRSGLAVGIIGTTRNATEVTSWGSTTTVTSRDSGNAGGDEMFWLALELENGVWCGIIDTPTSTGTQAYTGVGFRPGALLVVGTMIATVDSAITDADAGSIGYGIWCNDGGEYCVTAQAENGAGTSNTQSYANTKIMDLPIDDGGAGITATMVSADADGFTLNYTAVLGTARKWLVFALEDGSVFIPDFVKVGTTRGMVAGMP